MKKVLLTKSIKTPCTALTASKIQSNGSASTTNNIVGNKSFIVSYSNNGDATNMHTYQQRKSMEPAYKDLFKALFGIPDEQVQKRVLDAINGWTDSSREAQCKYCKTKKAQLVEAATQTENVESNPNVNNNSKEVESKANNGNHEEKSEVTPTTTNEDASMQPVKDSTATDAPKRKRRRRKVCLPQVVKRSQAQQAYEQPQPKLKKCKLSDDSSDKLSTNDWTSTRRSRSDSLISINSINSIDSDTLFQTTELPLDEHIKNMMTEEYLKSEHMENGLLPIHNAILTNDLKPLRRQIFVWKVIKKFDLNELLTDRDEDCLQLAVSNNCYPKVVEVLLESGLLTNSLDMHSNTLIHMALLNEIDLETFDKLMRHINPEMLLKLNDEGHTPLHVAIRQNSFLLAECMLNVLDERLRGKALYKREHSSSQVDFLKFYEHVCKHLNTHFAVPKIKRKLLEIGEMCSGNTALFYAIENKLEHFIYFLLAHLTDPRVQNHSGQDAKTFFGEFGKLLNLSLNIDKSMDKVINLIK